MNRTILWITIVLALFACSYVLAETKIEPGDSQAALENAVEFSCRMDTKWQIKDVVVATVSNPLKDKLKGRISLAFPGADKPIVRKFSVSAGKKDTLELEPRVVWDGRSPVIATAAVTFDGSDAQITREIDLGTSQRLLAQPACPIDRVLEFRITSPLSRKVTGKLKLFDVNGLKLARTTTEFSVDAQTVVAFVLDEPAPREFSFGYELVDIGGRRLLRSSALNYTILEDFSSVPSGTAPSQYNILADGNRATPDGLLIEGVKRETHYTALPEIPTCRLKYEIGSNPQTIRFVPAKNLPLPEKPLEIGFWISADATGDQARCRVVDSNNRLFESNGFAIDWKGWRYKTIPLYEAVLSGGDAERKPVPPLSWDTLLLLDAKSRGTIYLGPIMVVSEPVEPE